jgi:two-component system cell cycle sensor histidine kinase PleC
MRSVWKQFGAKGQVSVVDEDDENLARAQLLLALSNLSPNSFLMPIFAAFICVLFYSWVPLTNLVLWWTLVTIGGIPLGVVCTRALRQGARLHSVRRWVMLAAVGHLTFAISWSSMAWFLWMPGVEADHSLLLILLACTLAGNMALVGASQSLTINGYIVHGGAFVLLPLREGGRANDLLSLLGLLFVGYLVFMSTRIFETARRMLTLAQEKNALLDEKSALLDEKNVLIEALLASKSESDRANSAKSEFLANMSHELRTPMNAILGFSEVIKDELMGPNGNPIYRSYAGDIHASGAHLLHLINSVLDLSKIEAGKLELKEANIDLYEVVEDAARIIGLRAKDKGVQLINDVPRGVRVFADASALRQVALNLATNAVKFTPRGGSVRASLFAKDGQFGLLVRDTGCGIEREDMKKIFETFGQGKHDVANSEQGTGLGLPIARGLMRAHGGDITVRSTVGKGSSFLVTLPLERIVAWPEGMKGEAAA